jgi:MFS family permease
MLQWLKESGAFPSWHDDGKTASWHVLKQHHFLVYFVGSLISNLGTWLQNTAQMLLAYQLTHSAFAVGLVTCAQFSSFLLVGPWAASLAGRVGSKRALIGSQFLAACFAVALAILQFSHSLTELKLTVGALGMGFAFTFALPVQTAMVPSLVPKPDTKAALAMNSVSYNAGRMLAPVLCVAIVTGLGAGWAFLINAITFVVFAIVIVAIYPRSAASPKRQARDWLGFRIAIWHPRILLLLAMVTAVTIAEDPILVLGPALAHQVLGVSSAWPAFFLAALGWGTVLGALVPTKPSTTRRAAVPLLVLAFSVVVFASGAFAWLSLLMALVAGMAGLLTGAAVQTVLLQTAAPGQDGQIMTLWVIAWAGSKPIASPLDGWLAIHVGVSRTGVVLALPALAVVLVELFLWIDAKNWLKERVRAHTRSPSGMLATASPRSAASWRTCSLGVSPSGNMALAGRW